MNPAEEIVWQQIRERNLPAFESYYKEHFKEFFLVAHKYVRSVPVSQEIVNDVFLKIWEDAESITIESSLKAYIYKAVANRSINALHKQQKEIQNQREWAQAPHVFYEERQIETHELKVQLYKAIDNLPEQCRKVFQLSRFEGLKQQEIADKLGISIKTVKNHITHALKLLASYADKLMTIILIILFFFNITGTRPGLFCLINIAHGLFI